MKTSLVSKVFALALALAPLSFSGCSKDSVSYSTEEGYLCEKLGAGIFPLSNNSRYDTFIARKGNASAKLNHFKDGRSELYFEGFSYEEAIKAVDACIKVDSTINHKK